jgi:hypothetical protein
MGVYKRAKETLRVVPGSCQFFYDVRFAATRVSSEDGGVWRHARNVNAVGPASSPLVEASPCA